MSAIDPNMKPELDEFDHPIHFVSKVFPGLHIGEYVENWAHYWKTEKGSWDVEIYKTKYEDGHVREWPRKHVSDAELADTEYVSEELTQIELTNKIIKEISQ